MMVSRGTSLLFLYLVLIAFVLLLAHVVVSNHLCNKSASQFRQSIREPLCRCVSVGKVAVQLLRYLRAKLGYFFRGHGVNQLFHVDLHRFIYRDFHHAPPSVVVGCLNPSTRQSEAESGLQISRAAEGRSSFAPPAFQ